MRTFRNFYSVFLVVIEMPDCLGMNLFFNLYHIGHEDQIYTFIFVVDNFLYLKQLERYGSLNFQCRQRDAEKLECLTLWVVRR